MVELVVVIGMIALFISLAIALLNPLKQLEKAKDATRRNDAVEIKNSLDAYYNDHNCYPTSLPFGSAWKQGNTVYMAKVPQDPDYPNKSYVYEVDKSQNCPQWATIFANLYVSADSSVDCPLTGIQNCLPNDYRSTFSCSILGNVDCSYINSNPVGFPTPTPRTTTTPTPSNNPNSPTPSSTVTPPNNCSKDYACTGNPTRCNFLGQGANTGQYCSSDCNRSCQQ